MERSTKEKSDSKSFDERWFRGPDAAAPLQKSQPRGDESGPSAESFWKTLFSLDTLKGFALFVPGAFLLALIGVVATVIFADVFVYGRPYENLPETTFEQLAMLTVVGLIAGFMTWIGIGSLKDRRHVALPASAFATGVIIGIIGTVAEALTGGSVGDFIENFADNHIAVYLLPLILTVPVLVRGWLSLNAQNGPASDNQNPIP